MSIFKLIIKNIVISLCKMQRVVQYWTAKPRCSISVFAMEKLNYAGKVQCWTFDSKKISSSFSNVSLQNIPFRLICL